MGTVCSYHEVKFDNELSGAILALMTDFILSRVLGVVGLLELFVLFFEPGDFVVKIGAC